MFGDFTADSNGRISAFTVDGIDITPRLGDPSDAVTFGPVTARVLSSYRTASSDVLIIVLEIAVKADLSFASVARYTDPSGQTVEQTDAVVPKAFSVASASTIALIFPPVDPGGHLTLELAPVPGGTSTVVDLVVPALLGGARARRVARNAGPGSADGGRSRLGRYRFAGFPCWERHSDSPAAGFPVWMSLVSQSRGRAAATIDQGNRQSAAR